ncbi:hypothetical protein BDC45DRAFT_534041 [Circinella umbellata]|nr:hypothetical protein BDC45DRAFT_534041 [Circinella umbellata]
MLLVDLCLKKLALNAQTKKVSSAHNKEKKKFNLMIAIVMRSRILDVDDFLAFYSPPYAIYIKQHDCIFFFKIQSKLQFTVMCISGNFIIAISKLVRMCMMHG